jgi:hypothetical protein
MINIQTVKVFITDTKDKTFGFDYSFKPGLNILSGDNSSGKSTVLSVIYYCLGMEQLASYGNSDGLKECLKSRFKYNNENFRVFSSYAELYLTNRNGDIAIVQRTIKGAYQENNNIISVRTNNKEPQDKFLHAIGDTDHENGFYRWLSEYSEIAIPIFVDDDGSRQKILYLQQIFASSFVEQTKGWSDFFAQIPIFNTKKAKQKIIEYTLGLSGLVEEFELDRLKEREKEYKAVWANTVDAFQAVVAYNNFVTANLSETFSADISPKKIAKLALQTRNIEGNYQSIEDIIEIIENQVQEISRKNEISHHKSSDASELIIKHAAISEKLQYLQKEYQTIQNARINEEIKIKKYLLTINQLNREIEALEGIKKLNELKSFKIGSVENCPVCNSSLLGRSELQFSKIDLVNSSNSLSFYKSEKSLYESYVKSSEKLMERFEKTHSYYEERIAEIKNALSILDRQLLDDSRVPSRIDINEEIQLKFELEKLKKIRNQFIRFKNDLTELTNVLALIRNRKNELRQNTVLDEQKVLSFRLKFVEYLKLFGYSKEILNRITISEDESNKLFPVVLVQDLPPQPIRLVSSASDFIRAQWAFYMTLLVKAKLHLGILVLDEPGQHAIASADLIQLLRAASSVKDRQIILAISKEDKVKISTSESGEQLQEIQISLFSILEESGLIKDIDYTLNMIEDHGRKDKCIQPI